MRKLYLLILLLALGTGLGCKLTDGYYIDRTGKRVVITSITRQCVLSKYIKDASGIYLLDVFDLNYTALKQGIYTHKSAFLNLRS